MRHKIASAAPEYFSTGIGYTGDSRARNNHVPRYYGTALACVISILSTVCTSGADYISQPESRSYRTGAHSHR